MLLPLALDHTPGDRKWWHLERSLRGWKERNQKWERWGCRTSLHTWQQVGWGLVGAVWGSTPKPVMGPEPAVYMKWWMEWRRIPVQPGTPPLGLELWVVWVHPNSYFEFENIFGRWIIALHVATSKWEQTARSNDLMNLIFRKLLRISCPWDADTFYSPSAPLPPALARLLPGLRCHSCCGILMHAPDSLK